MQRLKRLTPYFSGQRWAWGLAIFATLIGAAGFFVIFFAGLPWRVLLIGLSGFAATLPPLPI